MSNEPTELVDDPDGIPDSSVLYRRVDWNKAGGESKYGAGELCKMSSNFFSDFPEQEARARGLAGACMSVGVEAILRAHGRTPEYMLKDWPEYGLVRVLARDLRALARPDGEPAPHGIMLNPTPEEPWHAVVFSVSSKRTESLKKRIALAAEWVIELRRVTD